MQGGSVPPLAPLPPNAVKIYDSFLCILLSNFYLNSLLRSILFKQVDLSNHTPSYAVSATHLILFTVLMILAMVSAAFESHWK